MISEACPVCEKSDWKFCEKKKFYVCKNCNPEKIIETEADEKENESQQRLANLATCWRCGSNDWWSPTGSIDQRCFVCQKPSSLSLVGCHYFFDDLGVRWLIETGFDGREVWTKEAVTLCQQ